VEIDSAIDRGECSSPVTFAEAQKLSYLQAVNKEALRMHPATGLPLYRIVPKEGAMVAGTFFPAGVSLIESEALYAHIFYNALIRHLIRVLWEQILGLPTPTRRFMEKILTSSALSAGWRVLRQSYLVWREHGSR
jgi:hypothetical protein